MRTESGRTSRSEKDDLPELTFEQVLAEEREWLRRRRTNSFTFDAEKGATSGTAFSLAFSGGGIRAAAFQAGVLWRLAQAGRLKDVEYFTAVSGGAYIAAAFASHLLAADPPDHGEEVDAWYLSVVAKTIGRMQQNAGGFIRDPAGNPFGFPRDGSGVLPRIFDVPILIATLCLTLVAKPLQILIVYLVPITEAVQLFFGGALRAAFCAPDKANRWTILMDWSPFGLLMRILEAAVAFNFLVWLLSKLPLCRIRRTRSSVRAGGYLFVNGALAFLLRFSAILALTLFLLSAVPYLQMWEYRVNLESNPSVNMTREIACRQYVETQMQRAWGNKSDIGLPCANFYQGKAWYRDPAFTALLTAKPEQPAEILPAPVPPVPSVGPQNWPFDLAIVLALQDALLRNGRSVIGMFFGTLFLLVLIGVLLLPFAPYVLLTLLAFTGPALALILIILFGQYRIYGPITNQSLFFEGWEQFDQNGWDSFVVVCLLSSMLTVPFYSHVHKIWHWYYVRCLQMNFFDGGHDRPFTDLGENPLCPLMMFTGTVNDFKPLGSHQTITEVSFTALHTGSGATGFLRTPADRTLAKCTALTGAGCLDAISLSMSHRLRFRFLLEMLNLSWGDYILFNQSEGRWTQRCARRAGTTWGPAVTWMLHQAPSLALWMVVIVLLSVGWKLAKDAGNQECRNPKYMVAAAATLLTTVFMLSFFSFQKGFQFLMFSPLIRQFHQVSRFYFRGLKPPGLLYVTDGGVQDCTAIVQLMRRRVRCILLVLAAADPEDDLGVLRAAMDVALAQRLGSFFDMDNPRRDVRILLEEFKADKALTFFQIGLRYGWGNDQDEDIGRLVVVKNRLPPAIEGLPMQPLLTPEDIMGEEAEREECKQCGGLRAVDLGGVGCCDCCHFHGCNCGRKFPHLTGVNYLYVTPLLFSNLCRLGHDISEEAVELALNGRACPEEPARCSTGASGSRGCATSDPARASCTSTSTAENPVVIGRTEESVLSASTIDLVWHDAEDRCSLVATPPHSPRPSARGAWEDAGPSGRPPQRPDGRVSL